MIVFFPSQLQVKQSEPVAGGVIAKPLTKATVDTSVTDIDAALNSLQVGTQLAGWSAQPSLPSLVG